MLSGSRSARRSLMRMLAFSNGQPHTGEKTLSTLVPKIGLRTSFRCSVTAKAAAVPPRRPRTRRVDTSRATRGRFYGAERVSRPRTSTKGSANSQPHEAPKDAAHRVARDRPRRDRDRVEEGHVVAVHVRMGRVHDLGPEVAPVLLDQPVHLNVGHGVEAHVRQVEVHVVVHTELACGAPRLVVLPRAHLSVVRVLRRAAVGHADDPGLVAAHGRVERDRAAHAEDLVVRVRGEDEDPHPSRAPTSSGALVSTSSRSNAPSPQATTGPASTTVPAGASPAHSTGPACHTITFSSPRKVNAPGYGRVCARTQS